MKRWPRVLGAPPRARVLCLAPHADDEVLGCGGALALHRAQGDPVRVLVAFDGRLGLPAGSAPGVRRDEALRGGARLGLEDYVFLEHPEGHAPDEVELARGADELAREVRRFAAELVYVPWPGDGHPDHRCLARAARLALAGFAGRVWDYEVWTPMPAVHVLDVGVVWERKLAALGEHASQLARDDLAARVEESARRRGVHCPSRRGEAFAAWKRPRRVA